MDTLLPDMEAGAAHPLPLHARKVFTGTIFSVWQWQQELFDGTTALFERLSRPDYAFVIGVLPDRSIMLVEDEQPDRARVLTGAGGGLEAGETAEQGAARELKEETGYQARELVPWFSYRPSNKIEMRVHAFIGRDLHHASSPNLDAGEKVTIKNFSFDEFLSLGKSSELRDWLLRIKLLTALLEPREREKLHTLLYG